MQKRRAQLAGATTLVLLSSFTLTSAAEVGICTIVAKPADFNHQTVALLGTATSLKETTSRRGNDYTTFKLQDPSGCGAVSVFTWGRAAMKSDDGSDERELLKHRNTRSPRRET